jgi:hypothetical protein
MTVRDLIFLYCYLIYDQNNQEILTSLPQERSDLLKSEFKKFDRFPKEVRLNVVLKLLGYLVQHVRNPHLEMVHPSWIAESLRKEDFQIKQAILQQFSPEYRSQVASYLKIPGNTSQPELLSAESNDVIFQIFCSRFASMAPPWGDLELTLDTIYLFKEEDLLVLIKQLGVREIGRALAIAGREALASLIGRFPRELQDDFLKAVKLAITESAEKQKVATKRLSKYDLGSMPLEEATLKVGIAKLGALLQKRADGLRKMAQRLPFELGMLLLQSGGEDGQLEEEEEVMTIVRRLISKQKIAFATPESSTHGAARIPDKDLLSE